MIDSCKICEIGEKEKNEDAAKIFVNHANFTYGFVLADGLGGHGNGDIASAFVTDCIGAAVENTEDFSGSFIDECFETAQNMLLDEKEKTGLTSIKTTMVFLILNEKTATWGHIGDSRIYHFRDSKMISRTIDHSVPQMLAISGKIKESEIRHHPDRCILLSAMGSEWTGTSYEIDARDVKVKKGDTFLLCSDGFWEWIDEKTISRILKKDLSAYDALQEMKNEIVSNGKGHDMDNYSAILINIK